MLKKILLPSQTFLIIGLALACNSGEDSPSSTGASQSQTQNQANNNQKNSQEGTKQDSSDKDVLENRVYLIIPESNTDEEYSLDDDVAFLVDSVDQLSSGEDTDEEGASLNLTLTSKWLGKFLPGKKPKVPKKPDVPTSTTRPTQPNPILKNENTPPTLQKKTVRWADDADRPSFLAIPLKTQATYLFKKIFRKESVSGRSISVDSVDASYSRLKVSYGSNPTYDIYPKKSLVDLLNLDFVGPGQTRIAAVKSKNPDDIKDVIDFFGSGRNEFDIPGYPKFNGEVNPRVFSDPISGDQIVFIQLSRSATRSVTP